jgi:hypothetical protein
MVKLFMKGDIINQNGKILLNNYNNQKTISFTSKKLKNGKQK